MTNKLQWIVPLSAAAIVLLSFAAVTFANPFYTGMKAKTSTATTTLAYLNAGTATSTLVYDSYEQSGTNETNSGNITIPNTVALAIQGVGSSTSAVLNVTCEFSDDNVDWYQNEIFPATSTGPIVINTPVSFTYTNASSTIGGVVATGFKKLVQCPVPLRFVRAIIGNTGAGVGIWAAFIPTKQRN